MKLLPLTLCTSMLLALAPTGISLADDGEMLRRNVSRTPALESAHAAIRMLPLYVPAQSASGELVEIEYNNADATLIETRVFARPLISHYTDGHVEGVDEEGYGGFPGHGNRDAFGAVSLDDGETWKETNLSKSGNLSSIRIKLGGRQKIDYPGDVGRSFMASDGNKVLVVWVSRYARGGNPTYAIADDELPVLADRLAERGRISDAGACTDLDLIGTPCLYLEDHFAVSGSQGTSDMADEGLPLIGELPYAAVWAARGVMLPPGDDGLSTFVWFKAERLTSAVRDANRPEVACVKGAGCVVTWQEDPDGMRPGEGEGPGEGWSGAIAHHQTDTWYSYIHWDDFDLVIDDDLNTYGELYDGTGDLAAWVAATDSGSPGVAIPMAIPVRLTDNSMCVDPVGQTDKPYCYASFDDNATADFCASSVSVTIDTPEGPTQTVDMCITEDGRLMRGNTASTRPRIGLHGYSSDENCSYDPADPDACPIDSAWFYMAYEENKGLGEDGEEAEVSDDPALKVDMGKNIWYHTFDMFQPELVSQGLMLNQPAVYREGFSDPSGLLTSSPIGEGEDAYNFYTIDPDPIYMTQANLETTLYQTEIARRSSPISQDWYDRGSSNLVALQLWKQGIVRRGGPADIMGRRFVMTEEGGTTTYQYCPIIGYTQIVTTYEELMPGECEWVDQDVWIAYDGNPAYNPNPSCNRKPDQPKCFEFIDLDGTLTNEEGFWTTEAVEVCEDDYWQALAEGETCDPLFEPDTCRTETYTEMVDNEADCDDLNNCDPVEDCQFVTSCDGVEYPEDCDSENPVTGGVDDNINPYGYDNMVCEDAEGNAVEKAFTDGTNPRYVKGFCPAPAINLSGNTILVGETCTDATACLEAFPFNEYFDDLDMTLTTDGISKILEWQQFGPNYGEAIIPDSDSGDGTNFNDMSWENPYDVAKGHRGFMTGDMVMVMYAWSNNWQALTAAHDIFNLYNRRSFDGGLTWTTLPTGFEHASLDEPATGNGTTTCEWMGPTGTLTEEPVCTAYLEGEFEQARNVSQLLGHQVTVLDPRYAPTARSITETSVGTISLPESQVEGFSVPDYPDNIRDPSRYFMVYETGHASAYDAGEAPPLDLFYSRAIEWGDQYLVWNDVADPTLCVPSADDPDLLDFCNEFDALEGKSDQESGEASVTASPDGRFFYSLWNQEDLVGEEVVGSDVWFRRVLFLDDYPVPVPSPEETTP